MAKWFILEILSERITNALEDNTHPLYAQVNIVDEKSKPAVRTVLMRYISGHGTLGFFTHVHSPEWQYLMRRPTLTGSFQGPQSQEQYRWRGPVQLLHGERHDYILHQRWLDLREDVRKSFWLECNPSLKGTEGAIDLAIPCPSIGIVLCHPDLWEISKTNEGVTEKHRYIRRDDDWIQVN